ncbi:hypothetical protein PoB_001726500 [Plakobranchus ocellatus]|uniref:Uncharacterized protein n=1 Tax=Plakobranchus ocellatus TaxID=259542 RepID=A0AAV3Z863_9GAST|nr:hypothetical protein PoB_001726500 [Plakobranchus ocellatus]
MVEKVLLTSGQTGGAPMHQEYEGQRLLLQDTTAHCCPIPHNEDSSRGPAAESSPEEQGAWESQEAE